MYSSFNENGNLMCSSKIIHTPHEGHFFKLPSPWNFHFRRCLPYPPPPVISLIFQLGWIPPGKNTFLKNAVALYFYVIDNCFCDREKTADILRRQQHFSCKMTPEKRVQKFHTDGTSLPRSG